MRAYGAVVRHIPHLVSNGRSERNIFWAITIGIEGHFNDLIAPLSCILRHHGKLFLIVCADVGGFVGDADGSSLINSLINMRVIASLMRPIFDLTFGLATAKKHRGPRT